MNSTPDVPTPRATPESREIAHVFLALQSVKDRIEFAELLAIFFRRLRVCGYSMHDIATALNSDVATMEEELLVSFHKHFTGVSPAISRPHLNEDSENGR